MLGICFLLFLSIRGFACLCLKLGFDAPHVFVALPVADLRKVSAFFYFLLKMAGLLFEG